jgi:ferrochelatase
MSEKTIGILLMSYGTPANLEEVEPYYTHIRRGRKPSPEALEDLVSRYRAIGGVSPLTKITNDTAERLQDSLNTGMKGLRFKVYQGTKHVFPYVGDGVKQMAAEGINDAVGLVLAPHYSTMSIGTYIQYAEEAVAELSGKINIQYVENWHMTPGFLDIVSKRVKAAYDTVGDPDKTCVIFSAHSLPERILQIGDPYPEQIAESAKAIAEQVGVRHYVTAWQSAGRTPEPWLGPDIMDVIRELHGKGYETIISCPFGFVSDHLEVLYDIDIECQKVAEELGIKLIRTENLNADDDFIEVLREIITDRISGGLHG